MLGILAYVVASILFLSKSFLLKLAFERDAAPDIRKGKERARRRSTCRVLSEVVCTPVAVGLVIRIHVWPSRE